MVLPLLGLLGLGVGLAAKPYYDRWSGNMAADNLGRRADEALDEAGPEAGLNDQAQSLLRHGLLSGDEYLQGGFPGTDEFALEAFKHALGREDKGMEARQGIVDKFQPQLDALNSQMGLYDQILGIANDPERPDALSRTAFLGTPEGRAFRAQLAEAEEAAFSDFKRSVYGEAEPPPEELKRLHDAFQTFTNGGSLAALDAGRWDSVTEIYERRKEETQRRAKALEQDYYRGLDAYDQNNLQLPGGLFGGEAVPTMGMSSRNLIGMESGGNWGATNDEGMSGRAQFSPARLDEAREGIGFNFSREDFLRSPKLQMAVEAWHWNDIDDFIGDEGLDEYVGGTIRGVPITMQGLRNVAHLGGKKGLRRFLASGGRYNPKDSNGTDLFKYLALGARG